MKKATAHSAAAAAITSRPAAASATGAGAERPLISPWRPASPAAARIEVVPIPVLADNYAYLVVDVASREAAAVDPADAAAVVAEASRRGLRLRSALVTHHHWDHAGGNLELQRLIPGVDIVGGDDRIDGLTRRVASGDELQIGAAARVRVLGAPCHTSGHVMYYVFSRPSDDPCATTAGDRHSAINRVDEMPAGALFSGDTLFVAGCGRFFEGTAAQMHHALYDVVGSLPADTAVFPGHEYTLSNLQFAAEVEPGNAAVSAAAARAKQARDVGLPTVPSSIAAERAHNPFMRVHLAAVADAVRAPQGADSVDVMRLLRERKDHWKPPS